MVSTATMDFSTELCMHHQCTQNNLQRVNIFMHAIRTFTWYTLVDKIIIKVIIITRCVTRHKAMNFSFGASLPSAAAFKVAQSRSSAFLFTVSFNFCFLVAFGLCTGMAFKKTHDFKCLTNTPV